MSLSLEVQRSLALRMLSLPPVALRAIAGPEIRSPEGYLLDLQVQASLRVSESLGHGEYATIGVARARKSLEASARVLQARPTAPLAVHDEWMRAASPSGEPGVVRARVYRPEPATGPLPIIVFYHGGGFALGTLRSHDGECRALASEVGAIVVSVDYRLAPEHRFPTAALDAIAAFRWVAARAESLGGDPSRIAVAGDSAGGNLAAVAARELRADPVRPAFQLLIYPAVDFTRALPSHRHFEAGFFLTKASIDWFIDAYAPSRADWTHPLASPLLQEDHSGLPPAFVLTAGFDPLRDEGDAYAAAMSAAGVKVRHRCYEPLVHGFFNMSSGVTAARSALDDMVSALREGLSVSQS